MDCTFLLYVLYVSRVALPQLSQNLLLALTPPMYVFLGVPPDLLISRSSIPIEKLELDHMDQQDNTALHLACLQVCPLVCVCVCVCIYSLFRDFLSISLFHLSLLSLSFISLSLSHTHTHSLSLTHTHTHSLSLTHSHTLGT